MSVEAGWPVVAGPGPARDSGGRWERRAGRRVG